MGSFSVSEIVFILVVILVIFGPRRLPEMARKAGEWAGKARRSARELQAAFRDEYREEAAVLDDLKREVDSLRRDIKSMDPGPPAELGGRTARTDAADARPASHGETDDAGGAEAGDEGRAGEPAG